jgi:UDP-N-acetylmuramate--alanine ligase
MKIDLGKNELIHFVGIGGIGMSGLALIMNGLGYKVQGSDIVNNRNIERLNEKKIRVFLNHKKENIKKTTLLVISSAIKKNNPELVEAIKKDLPVYTRGDMLGHIVSFMRNAVVTGSHGKTTTTSLVASIFTAGNLDPTIINGGVLNSFGNSAKLGKSNWCVTESDESDGSFLKIPFTYSIITNLDSEQP